jgi:hypothetical protein
MKKLFKILLDLDSDEGIRIEDYKNEKKMYITRNLLGTYSILIRTRKNTGNKHKEKNTSDGISGEFLEKIHNYDTISHVMKFINQNTCKPDIWLY